MLMLPDSVRRSSGGLVLALGCTLCLCGWPLAAHASGKKAEAVAEITPEVAPEEMPGVHVTPEGFTVVESVEANEALREEYARAMALLDQERYAEGAAALTRITEQAPNLTAVQVNLGIALSRAGELEKAEASLKHALELNPRHPVAWNELGLVQRRSGRFAEARASYEKALQIAPDFHFAQLNLAILCDLYLPDAGCALQNYVAYQQAVPDDRQAAIWIADLRARSGQQE